MYFFTAKPVPGQFLKSIQTRFPACHCASALVVLLATMATPVNAMPRTSALPEVEPVFGSAEPASTRQTVRPTIRSKTRPAAQRSKDAAARVSVTAAPANDKVASAPAAPAAGGERWDIVIADRTLNAAMARWAAAAGWQLLWELPVDYAVQAQTTVPGKFEDAVTVIVNSMEGAEIPMKAVFYSGNKVLRIMAKGAQ